MRDHSECLVYAGLLNAAKPQNLKNKNYLPFSEKLSEIHCGAGHLESSKIKRGQWIHCCLETDQRSLSFKRGTEQSS